MLKRLLDLFLFTSLFIALCAVLMVYQSVDLLHITRLSSSYLYFVFFSTLCSYNFHWYLTPLTPSEELRVKWTQEHRVLHLVLFITGLAGAAWFSMILWKHILWIALGALLTFLYSAPKIALPPFSWLKKIAVGKTIFLAFVWMYVTTALPVLVSGSNFDDAVWFYCGSRFFLIYSICIIFDYRDRTSDRMAGIRSMITILSEKGINVLFAISLLLFVVFTLALADKGFSWYSIACILLPGVFVLSLYKRAKRDFSDYLYYFVLDGLMMFSAIFTSLF